MRRTLTLIFLLYSALGVAVSFLFHSSLYFGFDARRTYPTAWLLLHLSIVLSWAAVFGVYLLSRGMAEVKHTERAAPALVVLTLLFVLCMPYAIFNFIYTNELLLGGGLGVVEGQNVILVKGRVAKMVLQEELPRYELYEARRSSGHWMVGHLIPCLFLYMYAKWGIFE